MLPPQGVGSAFLACPDARQPAYQAAIGLERAGLLGQFLTGYYYRADAPLESLGRRLAPRAFSRIEPTLRRRHEPGIPAEKVQTSLGFDAALRIEARLAGNWPRARDGLGRWRTDRFDRRVAREVEAVRPRALLAFSDVASDHAIPRCKTLGIPTVLSMVHGEVREEMDVLDREAERSPETFDLYLGDGTLDRDELRWLHDRRLRELSLADRVLVPSEHIAERLARHGTPPDKIRIIPYAADTERFRPDPGKRFGPQCTFLFAGGISQRKGIKYLLEAWQEVRREGWRLQLLGALPRDTGPLDTLLEGVEILGRVPHSEVPARMAAADVFVFPSLFEGSAVVTYEALACGLPSIVTLNAGSIVRDRVEGDLVAEGDKDALAAAMVRLGSDPELRREMAGRARCRAESFGWPRYHASVVHAVESVLSPGIDEPSHANAVGAAS